MKSHVVLSSFSLRTKLVLSYLGIVLGAILILSIVVTQVVRYNFANQQHDTFVQNLVGDAGQIGTDYHTYGGNWNSMPQNIDLGPDFGSDPHAYSHQLPSILFVVDTTSTPRYHRGDDPQSPLSSVVNINSPIISQCVTQVMQGQSPSQGQLQGSSSYDGHPISAYYVCEPIYDNGQSNNKIVGALFAVMSDQYASTSPPALFLENVNVAIFITGAGISLIAIIISLFLARGLTKPLKSLTIAAERMQGGDYTQRVVPPNSRDEIGHLSYAFNAMAGTIETDVTELRRQEQLRRDLIGNIAHDLATPLTAVQGFSEALADDVITNTEVRQETAQLIGREVQRLRRLVGDMQNMNALESGRLRLDLAALDLHSLVNETLDVIGFECEQVDINIHNDMPLSIPLVLADSDRITQVLLNLLDNARRHTPEGGFITIGARPEGRYLTVWISDTGTGIDPVDLPNIFERFYRADRSRTTTTGGSGLGLAIVKAIITAHEGTIRAESQPGQGTSIVFTLPLAVGA